MGTPAYTLNAGDAHQPADLVAAELQPGAAGGVPNGLALS
jgi:hypothetical protein